MTDLPGLSPPPTFCSKIHCHGNQQDEISYFFCECAFWLASEEVSDVVTKANQPKRSEKVKPFKPLVSFVCISSFLLILKFYLAFRSYNEVEFFLLNIPEGELFRNELEGRKLEGLSPILKTQFFGRFWHIRDIHKVYLWLDEKREKIFMLLKLFQGCRSIRKRNVLHWLVKIF